tara:strand:- start:6837 stop:7901 length:1065 start_codon:yes stop_codon:yes gene_type:complete
VTTKNKKKDVKYPTSRNLKLLHNALIFRPVKRGRRRKNVKYNFANKDTKVAVKMDKQLDVADQDLMITLFAIARSKEFETLALNDIAWIDKDGNHQAVKELMSIDLGVFAFGNVNSASLRSIQIDISKYALLKEMNKGVDARSYAWLSESLERLANTRYTHDGKKWAGSFSMISYLEDKESGHLLITINPIASYAIRRDDAGYVMLHRGERAQLKTEEAKVLHSILCSLVDPSKQLNLNLSMLSEKVWGVGEDDWSEVSLEDVFERYDEGLTLGKLKEELEAENPRIRKLGSNYEMLLDEPSLKTQRNRMSQIKKALECEINELESWSVEVTGRGKSSSARVRRKKAVKTLLKL